jgi:hypothetical protein
MEETMRKQAIMAAVLAMLAPPAAAQEWPGRPVTLVVPYAAGGPNDTIARVLSGRLAEILNGQMLIRGAIEMLLHHLWPIPQTTGADVRASQRRDCPCWCTLGRNRQPAGDGDRELDVGSPNLANKPPGWEGVRVDAGDVWKPDLSAA